MFFIRFNLIRKSLENMLQEMLEEETKHMNTAEVTLLLKTTVSKFIEKEIYHNRLEINSYCKENNHLSVIWLRFQMSLIFDNFFQNLQQKIDGKLLKSSFFWSRSWTDLNYAENKNSSQLKQERGPIFEHMVCFVVVKLSFVTSIGL